MTSQKKKKTTTRKRSVCPKRVAKSVNQGKTQLTSRLSRGNTETDLGPVGAGVQHAHHYATMPPDLQVSRY